MKKLGILPLTVSIILLFSLIALGINILLTYEIIPQKEYGFWGSFLGGLLGAAATIIAIILTIKNNEKTIKYQLENQYRPMFICSEIRYFYNTIMRKDISYDECKIQIIDQIHISCFEGYKTVLERDPIKIVLKNVGLGPAMNINIIITKINNIEYTHDNIYLVKDHQIVAKDDLLSIISQISDNIDEISMIIFYKDIVGNKYKQELEYKNENLIIRDAWDKKTGFR